MNENQRVRKIFQRKFRAKNGKFDEVSKEEDERLMKLMCSASKKCLKLPRRNTELPAITENVFKAFPWSHWIVDTGQEVR